LSIKFCATGFDDKGNIRKFFADCYRLRVWGIQSFSCRDVFSVFGEGTFRAGRIFLSYQIRVFFVCCELFVVGCKKSLMQQADSMRICGLAIDHLRSAGVESKVDRLNLSYWVQSNVLL